MALPAALHTTSTDTLDTAQAARAYTADGLAVIPIPRGEKGPKVKGWQNASVGEHLHSIRPSGNIGIVAGLNSGGLSFLEIDGGDMYALVCETFPLLATSRTARSGGGGYHIYLRSRRMPPTVTYKPDKEQHREIKLKGEGQQCVAPPSLHPSGNRYTWHIDGPILEVDDLDDVVAWLNELNGTTAAPGDDDKPVIAQRERRQTTSADTTSPINPEVINAVETSLVALGFTYNTNDQGRWLNGNSLFRTDNHPSFGYNLTTGYAWDFEGRSYTTKEVCAELGINPANYGGLFVRPVEPHEPYNPQPVSVTYAESDEYIYAAVPDTLLAACYKYLPKTAPAALWLLHTMAADGVINPESFALPDILTRQERYGFTLPESTWRDVLTAFDGLFLRKCNGNKGHQSLQLDFRGNSTGRAPTTYELTPINSHIPALLKRAAYRIYENVAEPDSPGGAPVLVEPRPRMLEALGYAPDEAAEIAAQLHARYETAYAKQDHAERRAARLALDEYTALQFALQNPRSTPLPAGWMIANGRDFQALRLRGLVAADPDSRNSYQKLADYLGVERSSIPTWLKRAGIENVPQVAERELTLDAPIVQQAYAAGRELGGKPFEIVARYDNVKSVAIAYDPSEGKAAQQFVANHKAKGAVVTLNLRVASHQVIVDPDQDGPVQVSRPTTPQTTTEPVERNEAAPREYGERYDVARFVVPQLLRALEMLEGYQLGPSGRLYDENGVLLLESASPRDLVNLLLNGAQAQHAPDGDLLASLAVIVAELGGTMHRREAQHA